MRLNDSRGGDCGLVLRLLEDTQGKSGRLDQEEAKSQEFLGAIGEVEEENEDGEENGRWEEGRGELVEILGTQMGKYDFLLHKLTWLTKWCDWWISKWAQIFLSFQFVWPFFGQQEWVRWLVSSHIF